MPSLSLRLVPILCFATCLWACGQQPAPERVGAPLPPFDYAEIDRLDSKAIQRIRSTLSWLASGDDSQAPDYLTSGPVLHGGESAARDYLHALGRPGVLHALRFVEESRTKGAVPEGVIVFLGEAKDPIAVPLLMRLLLNRMTAAKLESLGATLPDTPDGKAITILTREIERIGVNAVPYLMECLKAESTLVWGIAMDLFQQSVQIPVTFTPYGWPRPDKARSPEAKQKLSAWWAENQFGLGWCPELNRFRNPKWTRVGP